MKGGGNEAVYGVLDSVVLLPLQHFCCCADIEIQYLAPIGQS